MEVSGLAKQLRRESNLIATKNRRLAEARVELRSNAVKTGYLDTALRCSR